MSLNTGTGSVNVLEESRCAKSKSATAVRALTLELRGSYPLLIVPTTPRWILLQGPVNSRSSFSSARLRVVCCAIWAKPHLTSSTLWQRRVSELLKSSWTETFATVRGAGRIPHPIQGQPREHEPEPGRPLSAPASSFNPDDLVVHSLRMFTNKATKELGLALPTFVPADDPKKAVQVG